jgi:hypothetical protein
MLIRFWRSDAGLSAFLALLILGVLVLHPLAPGWTFSQIVNDIVFSLLLIGGIAAASERPWAMAAMSFLTAIVLILRWALRIVPSTGLAEWHAVFQCLDFGLFTLVVMAQVFRDGPVTYHRIEGAIAVYLLLGFCWAGAYELVALHDPGAFAGPLGKGEVVIQSWVYFSYATLSTVGYGDITPVDPFARSLAVLEALVGQLYPAILIARLVSQEVEDRRRRD